MMLKEKKLIMEADNVTIKNEGKDINTLSKDELIAIILELTQEKQMLFSAKELTDEERQKLRDEWEKIRSNHPSPVMISDLPVAVIDANTDGGIMKAHTKTPDIIFVNDTPFKRYMIFAWDAYGANGGIGDMYSDFDKIEDALSKCNRGTFDRIDLLDRQTGKEIDWEKMLETNA